MTLFTFYCESVKGYAQFEHSLFENLIKLLETELIKDRCRTKEQINDAKDLLLHYSEFDRDHALTSVALYYPPFV